MSDQTRKKMKAVCKRALQAHGTEEQILKAVEELIELADALVHFRTKYKAARTEEARTSLMASHMDCLEIATEIADVEIMCFQLRMLFNTTGIVDQEMKYKLDRLNANLPASGAEPEEDGHE